ncbi:MAG: MBL fold metallo-hydrolase [Candidatus Obscuribacterales bacterium]|nr:MBL fold metallo-hydrolase [Candidatus Obscuribacterales bacterium]
MYFKQFYLGCLAHASYLIGSQGEAVVVDPQRDIDHYIETAAENGLAIKYIIETHLHADFVSGHRELAARTGAEIVFSHRAGATFDHKQVKEGDILKAGSIECRILETPGHTLESICILVTDKETSAYPCLVFTGDTLFVGDVGRPDLVGSLAAGSKEITPQDMASMLYGSLKSKLLNLEDDVKVYPAHGAGSLCGKNLSQKRSSTIGEQKKFNYALKAKTREEFIEMVCQDLPEVPQYFPRAVELNKQGAAHIETIKGQKALSPAEVSKAAQQGKLILDVRTASLYGAGHIPGSINIGLGGQFASWAGTLIDHQAEIILVAEDKEAVEEAVVRLARAGHESVVGYLDGGIYAWHKEGLATSSIVQLSVSELNEILSADTTIKVLDVRRPPEYVSGHVPGAYNIPLNQLNDRIEEVEKQDITYVICAGGYRSSAATSMLARQGLKEMVNVMGGTGAWKNSQYALETAESKTDSGQSCAQVN